MTRLFADFRPVTLLAAIPLAACAAAPPSGPTVFAMPRSGESLNQFQADDLACRNYVQTHTAPPGATQAAANRSAVGSAAVGTAVGASAGALLGAAAGNAGVGAAAGAGAGLLTGAAVGASNADAIAGSAQAQYDVAYAQCMTSKGNIIGHGAAWLRLRLSKRLSGLRLRLSRRLSVLRRVPILHRHRAVLFFGPHFHDGFHHHEGFHHEGFHHEGFHHEMGHFGH